MAPFFGEFAALVQLQVRCKEIKAACDQAWGKLEEGVREELEEGSGLLSVLETLERAVEEDDKDPINPERLQETVNRLIENSDRVTPWFEGAAELIRLAVGDYVQTLFCDHINRISPHTGVMEALESFEFWESSFRTQILPSLMPDPSREEVFENTWGRVRSSDYQQIRNAPSGLIERTLSENGLQEIADFLRRPGEQEKMRAHLLEQIGAVREEESKRNRFPFSRASRPALVPSAAPVITRSASIYVGPDAAQDGALVRAARKALELKKEDLAKRLHMSVDKLEAFGRDDQSPKKKLPKGEKEKIRSVLKNLSDMT